MSPAAPTEAHALAADLFRRESARMTASLLRLFGPAQLDLVEEVVQEALLEALQAWRARLPDDPVAWLLKTAANRALASATFRPGRSVTGSTTHTRSRQGASASFTPLSVTDTDGALE